MIPEWPPGTVAILVTTAPEPHAIPVSAVVRGGPERLLLGLAEGRGSLRRLRAQPRVAVALLAEDLAVTLRGRARVLEAPLVDGVCAVEVAVESVDDHLRPTFAIESGLPWHWIDPDAQARDAEVQAALRRLAAEPGPR